MRYILILIIIASLLLYFPLLIDGYSGIWTIVGFLLISGFQIIGGIWCYKDIIGWDNFENSEGLNLKRKK